MAENQIFLQKLHKLQDFRAELSAGPQHLAVTGHRKQPPGARCHFPQLPALSTTVRLKGDEDVATNQILGDLRMSGKKTATL